METVETRIALLASDIKQSNDLHKSLHKSVEKLTEVSETLSKVLAVHDVQLNRVEPQINSVASSTRKTDETISAVKEQLIQIKLENHIERETNHRELLAAISRGNTQLHEEFSRKFSELSSKVDKDLENIRLEVDGLKKFKWTTLGVLSVLSAEIVLRLYGLV